MDKIIFFTTLVLFPFGQIFKFGILNLFDIAVLLLAMVTLLLRPKYPEWYKYFLYFLLFCIFGLLANYSLFTFASALYLVRLWSYSMIAVYVSNFFRKPKGISQQLTAVAIVSAVFGWLQYLIWPDLTNLKYFGWDDHLLRMVGTFLDPTFLGLILVLGTIIALWQKRYFVLLFLVISVLFTYSRASYLVLFAVFLFDFIKNKNFKKFVICNFVFVILLLVIPKGIGEGTNLIRTASGNYKLTNYNETIEIFKKSPVLGVGFNNLCPARAYYLGDINTDSHSCSGSDSSILFLLATTGIVGTILFLGFVLRVTSLTHTTYYMLLSTSFVVTVVHSLLANSLFYPHIMFWLFSLVGLRSEVDRKRRT